MRTLAAAVIVLLIFPGIVLGGKATIPPFHLVSQTMSWSSNSEAPLDCLNEDDGDARTWEGSFSGTFTADEIRACDPNTDITCNDTGCTHWNIGGVRFGVRADAIGTLTGLTITSPSGEVTSFHFERSIDLGPPRWPRGTVENFYAACVVDIVDFYAAAGVWRYSVSGTFTYLRLDAEAEMRPVILAGGYCP